MRVPLSWLTSLTPLDVPPGDRAAVAELASELDALGLVVEGVERVGEGLGDVVLAQVVDIVAIEGADRIRRVGVDRGGERVEVVCGAWNFGVGDVVALAPVGSELPGGFRIERRKMKGVASNGMLCSAKELALGDDHAGILVVAPAGPAGEMPAGVELGRPLGEHLGMGADVVFDLAIEANRPDCLSVLGIARDLAARYSLPLQVPEPALTEGEPPAAELGTVEVVAPELCRRLTARVLSGVTVVASPPWLQRRLVLCGMRPINSVVDASNYVMLELGQPTHPYDLDALGGHGLKVRAAHTGETLVTLDGEARILGFRTERGGDPLSALDTLICNANDLPVGIAGIMGGESSEIGEHTARVLLEVAEFEPVAIGRTARALGLRTEASVRFERGVDPEGIERAGDRVCELVVESARAAGATAPLVAGGRLDDRPVPFRATRLGVRPARVNSVLGTDLDAAVMLGLLEPIGYRKVSALAGEDGSFELEVPSWRPDVSREVDVIEEVARTYGYRNIPRTDRRSPFVGKLEPLQQLRRQVRRVLAGLGAHEAWTSSIVDPGSQLTAGHRTGLVQLSNPMVAGESALRAGLLAGLLAAVRHNSDHRHPWLRLFEMGNVFSPAATTPEEAEPERLASGGVPDERERVALVLARTDDGADEAVHAWRVLADALGIVGVEIRQHLEAQDGAAVPAGLHPARSGHLVVAEGAGQPDAAAPGAGAPPPMPGGTAADGDGAGLVPGTVIGTVGEVDPDVVAAFGLPHARVGWLELNLGRLAAAPRRPLLAQPVSRYPSSDVDLAFVLGDDVAAAALETALRQAATELCESVELFDVYRGPGVEDGARSLAYRLRFCAQDRTLTDAEVADLRRRCIDAVESALPAALRG